MALSDLLNDVNPNFVIFLLTTLIAFLSWMIKALVERPLVESKATFNKIFESRLSILTEVKTKLIFIAYFPTGEDGLTYKQQLQDIFLKDGTVGYLSRPIYDNALKISIDQTTDEKLLLETIDAINEELTAKIKKIQDETSFYRKFSNHNPIKRIVGFAYLLVLYLSALLLVVGTLLILILALISGNYIAIFLIASAFIIILCKVGKWLN